MSRSKVKVTRDKNEKVQHFVRESSSGAQSSCDIFSGSVLTGMLHYAGGKISICCLTFLFFYLFWGCKTINVLITSITAIYFLVGH